MGTNSTTASRADCALCTQAGGDLIVRAPRWRVVRAAEAGFPAFYRIIWADHVREFSQLSPADRAECMDVVVTVERVLLQHFPDAKINLASFGNVVPHLHWHVIARFPWDSRFPGPVWAPSQRDGIPAQLAAVEQELTAVEHELAGRLQPR